MRTTRQLAQIMLKQRDARSRLLGRLGRLAEPCWLILLRIYADESSGRTTVVNVITGLDYGYATVHRYLQVLEAKHFIISRGSDKDGRLRILELTPATEFAMHHLLTKMALD